MTWDRNPFTSEPAYTPSPKRPNYWRDYLYWHWPTLRGILAGVALIGGLVWLVVATLDHHVYPPCFREMARGVNWDWAMFWGTSCR